MSKPPIVVLVVAAVAGAAVLALRDRGPAPLERAAFDALYASPTEPSSGPRTVFHLGHSLVGRDMPAMLEQLAGEGHGYASQLGWGAPLRSHWEPDVAINGFDEENAHERYRDVREALASGAYDALVVTEMVEIADAVRYHDTPRYLALWAEEARANGAAVYLYETWHELDDPFGWRARIERDMELYWEDAVLRPALARTDPPRAIHVVPGGQVMAAVSRALEEAGPVGPLTSHRDLYADEIHFNDLGAYLMALTHYAVLYQRSPVGLPHALLRADGSSADDPGAEAAALMQRIVWEVVTSTPTTGVRQE